MGRVNRLVGVFCSLDAALFENRIGRKRNAGGGVLASPAQHASAWWTITDSGDTAFQAITNNALNLGQLRFDALYVKVPVTQNILGVIPPSHPESNFQFESLILAQNERWRQA